MPPEARTQIVWPAARRTLRRHPVFGPLVERVGPVRVPATTGTPFQYLARVITHQQLAGAAARTIVSRLVTTLGDDVTPGRVLATPQEDLRAAGLSRAKSLAIRDLAERIATRDVDLDDVSGLSDGDLSGRLVRVRGIGPWTAQMYLMFYLHRPDVWPVLDLGVRAGYARVHGLETPPTARELEPRGDPHRPYRSAVAWYCWRALELPPPA